MSQSQNGREVEPADYATLNIAYGALLTALIVATRKRAQSQEPIPAIELVPMSAATFALAKVIAREKIGSWVREPFVEEDSTQSRPARPRAATGGRRARHVHALRRRLERARHRRTARSRAALGPDRDECARSVRGK